MSNYTEASPDPRKKSAVHNALPQSIANCLISRYNLSVASVLISAVADVAISCRGTRPLLPLTGGYSQLSYHVKEVTRRLITENFRINSGNNATKRKQEEALAYNYKVKVKPHSIDFTQHPATPNKSIDTQKTFCQTPERKVLGELQNSRNFQSPRHHSPLSGINRIPNSPNISNSPRISHISNSPKISYMSHSPTISQITSPSIAHISNSPTISRISNSPRISHVINSPGLSRLSNSPSITRLKNSPTTPLTASRFSPKPLYLKDSPAMERLKSPLGRERKRSKISKILEERSRFRANKENDNFHIEEETQDCMFGYEKKDWSMSKLNFSDIKKEKYDTDIYVPENSTTLEPDLDVLHDLEEEFDANNFDQCTKYEIISTDSPDIISAGRTSSRKVNQKDFVFGAPLSDNETSTSFNRPSSSRALNFERRVERTKSNRALKFDDGRTKFGRNLNFEDSKLSSSEQSFDFNSKTELSFEINNPGPSSSKQTKFEKKLNFDQNLSGNEESYDFNQRLEFDSNLGSSKRILSFGQSHVDKKQIIEESFDFNKRKSFEDSFEFASPMTNFEDSTPKKNFSVKKSLKFTDSPNFERQSSIGSMSQSPASTRSPCTISKKFTSESMESGFISELEEPFLEMEEMSSSPKILDFRKLLSGDIKDNFSIGMKPVRSLSKRGIDDSCGTNKRRKSETSPEIVRPVLQRAFSENNASIMSALARSVSDSELIGDFSLPFALPLTAGDHSDLKSISCDTLAKLIKGDYSESINDFQVIDCRYPYEYDGGHILGAVNLFTSNQILELIKNPPQRLDNKRSILVFHCEFSLERGPKLSRFLRSSDRAKNQENYPSLNYPEIYLLHAGYRSFYKSYPELCSPAGYTAMLDPQHKHLLRKHRSLQPAGRRNRLLM
ncbi:unnamed protein product [Leptosia nina]|uniref:protein-tyrosine-phosphatase n=1 Tax=Leptosia nina TaxID=320188 RepID=A0AAV1JYG4_9NEOP